MDEVLPIAANWVVPKSMSHMTLALAALFCVVPSVSVPFTRPANHKSCPALDISYALSVELKTAFW